MHTGVKEGQGTPIISSLGNLFWSIRHYSELLRFFVSTYLKLRYGNLVLGYLWWLLNPLLWIFVYWLLISVIFQRGTPQYPVFVACAILPWRSFAVSLGQAVTSISSKEKLIKQVAFPKYVLPVSIVTANTINLVFSMFVVIGIAMLYGIYPTLHVLWIIPLMGIQVALTLGMAFLLAVLGVYFVDTKNILEFLLRMWLYLSPSLYGLERIPDRIMWVFKINPFTAIFTGYRDAIMRATTPNINFMIISLTVSIIIFITGLSIFSRYEREFAKIV